MGKLQSYLPVKGKGYGKNKMVNWSWVLKIRQMGINEVSLQGSGTQTANEV